MSDLNEQDLVAEMSMAFADANKKVDEEFEEKHPELVRLAAEAEAWAGSVSSLLAATSLEEASAHLDAVRRPDLERLISARILFLSARSSARAAARLKSVPVGRSGAV